MPKKKKIDFLSVPCTFEIQDSEDNASSLVPVKITFMHDGENRNWTRFSKDTIDKCVNSIVNKPILAYIKRSENGEYDFAGHEIEYIFNSNGVETVYLERPVGVIPESTVIETYVEDGKTYYSCTGYIYRGYSNQAIDILTSTNGKCVSIEIEINSYEVKSEDPFIDITAFEILGITILSDEVTPAMDENCRINFYSNIKKNTDTFIKTFSASLEAEENKPESNFEDAKEDEEPEAKEPKEFSEPEKEYEETGDTENNDNDEPVETEFEADFEIEDEATAEVSVDKEFSVLFGVEINDYSTLLEVAKNYIENVNAELHELREYKNSHEKNKRIFEMDSLLESLDMNKDDFVQLYQAVVDGVAKYEDFEKEVFATLGRNSYKERKINGIRINATNENKTIQKESLYGGLLDNILGY